MKIINRTCDSCGRKIGLVENAPVTKDKKQICTNCVEDVFSEYNTKTMMWVGKHTFEEFDKAHVKSISTNLTKLTDQEKEKGLLQINGARIINFDNAYFDPDNKEALLKSNDDLFKFRYADIISYKPVERGHSEKKHHGIARAVTGGVLLGPVGAVVGATTGGKEFDYIDELGADISLSQGNSVAIRFVKKPTKQGADTQESYKQCSSLCALLDSIIAENNTHTDAEEQHTESSQENVYVADQLRKLKSLVDDGILTQEEFEAKKKQMLGI